MRNLVFPTSIACLLLACGGSTLETAPASDDVGVDGVGGDVSLDSALDARGDSSAVDSAPDGSVDAGTDSAPPPADSRPDVVTGDSGGGTCGPGGTCTTLLKCCGGACIYDQNDPLNCGGCGIRCTGETSMCEGGHCIKPSCAPACGDGRVCCDVNGPGPTTGPKCLDGPTCPIGCPLCE